MARDEARRPLTISELMSEARITHFPVRLTDGGWLTAEQALADLLGEYEALKAREADDAS